MATINNPKTNETRKTAPRKPAVGHNHKMEISRLYNGSFISFDLLINGTWIYGCKVQTVKATGEAFVSWPSRQGKDGKWYAVARPADWDEIDNEQLIGIVNAELQRQGGLTK